MKIEKVYVDTSWILYRSHYTFQHLNNGHVFGLLKFVHDIRTQSNVDLVLCIDHHPRRKVEVAPHYKDNRSSDRFNVHACVPDLKNLLGNVKNVYFSELHETEADDVMAYWAINTTEGCAIFSGDDDMAQLINERIRLSRFSEKGKFITLPMDYTMIKYGVEPHHIPMWKVIARDSSDNLVGIPRFPREILKGLCWKYEKPHNLVDKRQEVFSEWGRTTARLKYLVELYRLLPQMQAIYDEIVHLPTIVERMQEPSLTKGTFDKRLTAKYQLGPKLRKFLEG